MSTFKADLATHVIVREELFNIVTDSLRIGAKADVFTRVGYAGQDTL